MKNNFFTILLFLTSLTFSQSNIKQDIDDIFIDKLYIKSDSTLANEFQRYAIDLFKKGRKLNDSIFKETEFHRVGVCLIYNNRDGDKRNLEITLNTLSYKDL